MIHLDIHNKYVQSPTEMPYYVATARCQISSMWFGITQVCSGVLFVFVVILAIGTRHIKLDSFKDTKKVNAFTFLVVIINVIDASLWIVFREVGNQTAADISEWLPYFTIPFLCQVCLFLPKTLPLASKKTHKNSSMTTIDNKTKSTYTLGKTII